MPYTTSPVIGSMLTTTHTAPEFALGTRVIGTDNSEWVYVQADAIITQYRFVGIDENYQAALLTTAHIDAGWQVGVAQVAFADNEYGWVATKGTNITGRVGANSAADALLYTTGTAGELASNASTIGSVVDGIVSVAAATTIATNVEVMMSWPVSRAP